MGLMYVNKNCELYLGEKNVYRDDMTSLPLNCILTEEEYKKLSDKEKENYEVLVAKPEK